MDRGDEVLRRYIEREILIGAFRHGRIEGRRSPAKAFVYQGYVLRRRRIGPCAVDGIRRFYISPVKAQACEVGAGVGKNRIIKKHAGLAGLCGSIDERPFKTKIMRIGRSRREKKKKGRRAKRHWL